MALDYVLFYCRINEFRVIYDESSSYSRHGFGSDYGEMLKTSLSNVEIVRHLFQRKK